MCRGNHCRPLRCRGRIICGRKVSAIWSIAALAGMVSVAPALAQDTMTLRQAVDTALASRASLRAEAERVSASQGLRNQAGALPNPEFQFQNENLRPGQTYSRDVDTLAMINQPLDLVGKRGQRMAVADKNVARTRADYEVSRQDIVRRVRLAYWTARGSQEVREILKATAQEFQKVVDYHAAQLSVGAIAEQDLLRVRLERERLGISANLAVIDANRARVELLKEMGKTD